ncbi:MAG: HAD family hydrolase [Syntrophobacterales bacterium]|jgi:phosphoglycolate phosphatase|nr:HAD family hydrolase [Syntrophobacterales bacterium]
MTKLLLFDFDGVLIDSLPRYEQIVKTCLEEIGHPIVQTRDDFLDLFEDNFYEGLMKRGIDLQLFRSKLQNVSHEELEIHEAMLPVLEKLSENHMMVIISSNETETIRQTLDRFSIGHYFQDILGADKGYSKDEKIQIAMYLFAIAQDHIYYIGDTTGDVREARNAGVHPVAVTWGWHTRERILAARPDFTADTPEDLLQYLETVQHGFSSFFSR